MAEASSPNSSLQLGKHRRDSIQEPNIYISQAISLLMHSQTEWMRPSSRGGPTATGAVITPRTQTVLGFDSDCSFSGFLWAEGRCGSVSLVIPVPTPNCSFNVSCRLPCQWACSTFRHKKKSVKSCHASIVPHRHHCHISNANALCR